MIPLDCYVLIKTIHVCTDLFSQCIQACYYTSINVCRFIPRRLPDHIVDDNSLLANTAAIKLVTGLQDDDFVYITYHNKVRIN